MILGVGVDLIDIRRIEATLARFGERFLARVYTDRERELSLARPSPAAQFAQRYAGKEACAKALGTGFRQGVRWRDIELDRLPTGQPIVRLRGPALRRAHALTPAPFEPRLHVSLTDEPPFAQAVVVIYAGAGAG